MYLYIQFDHTYVQNMATRAKQCHIMANIHNNVSITLAILSTSSHISKINLPLLQARGSLGILGSSSGESFRELK